jgi:hypothetical protein
MSNGDVTRDALLGRWQHASAGDAALYAWNLLLGTRGWLLYTPLLALSAAALVWRRRRGADERSARPRGSRPDAAALLASVTTCVIVFLFYWALSVSYGGSAFGCRYLVDVTPLALIPWIAAAARDRRWIASWWAIGVIVLSTLVAALGAQFPWTPLTQSAFPLGEALRLLGA